MNAVSHPVADGGVGAVLREMPELRDFRFARLSIEGIDNGSLLATGPAGWREEETCLFHASVRSGDDYVAGLGTRIEAALVGAVALPVVRFADGEYAFYSGSLKCNGLYEQAESVAAIRAAWPAHVAAMRELAAGGVFAPLLVRNNMRPRRAPLAWFRKDRGEDLALRFLQFLAGHEIHLSGANYVPFYCVYAYLSSERFARAVDGKTVCIVNSDFHAEACQAWFARAGVRPSLTHVKIPQSYAATRWAQMLDETLRQVTRQPDCFLVGAGVGALQICVDLASRYCVPAIDAGHILNMMNDLEGKSGGPRLFTQGR